MSSLNEYLNKMPTVKNSTTVDFRNATTRDIIEVIHSRFFSPGLHQTAQIAESFRGKNELETCRNVWNFLRNKITYVRDPDKTQRVKVPVRFLHDASGDCKSFALFAASVLYHLGFKIKFRYTGYRWTQTPNKATHVYCVVEGKEGKIIVDGVHKTFNHEPEGITYKKDYLMNVETLAGIHGLEGIGAIGKLRLKKLFKKVGSKVFKGLKKVTLSAPRNAFLTLIALNVRGMASKFKKANPSKYSSAWKRLGGNPNKLRNAINKGAKKRPLFGGKAAVNGIGFSVEAVFSTAAPVILAMMKFIKDIKLSKEETGEETEPAEASADNIIKETYAAGGSALPPGAMVTDTDSGAGDGAGIPDDEDYENEKKVKEEGSSFEINPMYVALGVGGLALLLFMNNKKR